MSRSLGHHVIGFGKITSVTVINIPIGMWSVFSMIDVNFLFNTHVLKLYEC